MNSVEEGAAPLDTFIKLSGETSLMLFTCFNAQGGRKGMVVVNNMLLGCYWPHVGPQETLFTCILRRVAEGDSGGE